MFGSGHVLASKVMWVFVLSLLCFLLFNGTTSAYDLLRASSNADRVSVPMCPLVTMGASDAGIEVAPP